MERIHFRIRLMTNKVCLAAFIALFTVRLSVHAQGKLNVVTTTEDLTAIAREVGGDHITVDSIAKGYQDPHFVEAKPSFILKLQKADLLILVGRDLEIGWLPPLIQQSRNSKVQVGADGYLDASLQARILEIPQVQITRAEGDVHPLGNPHYWLDPENGKIIAREIFDRLARFRPDDRSYFESRLNDFLNRLNDAEKRWVAMMAPYKGTKMVTYHRSFPNFAERFGLDIVGYVEPKPGIPPTPQHTLDLINEMKKANVKLVLVRPCHRRGGSGHASIGRRSQGSIRLLQALRLRSQPVDQRNEENRCELGAGHGHIRTRISSGPFRRQPDSHRHSRLSRRSRRRTWCDFR